MPKFVLTFVLGVCLLFPFSVSAQQDVALSNVSVQLWPEYDRPSMLVIVDFKVAPMTPLPVDLTFRIPSDSNLIAVALEDEGGNLLNANFAPPAIEGEWQSFVVSVEKNVTYRFEYYQPLMFNNNDRVFTYVWNNLYAVKNLSINVLEPIDAKNFTSEPAYVSVQQVDGLNYYEGQAMKVESNQEVRYSLQYTKSTDTLVSEPQAIQSSQPLDEDTAGRMSMSKLYPYVLGGLGVLAIAGGLAFYWRASRAPVKKTRRRKNTSAEEDENKTARYCSQCGSRAKMEDKFCRTCGSRL